MINNDCSVCLTENILPSNKCITECNHQFCKDCLDDWFQRGNKSCPLCRGEITEYKHQNEKFPYYKTIKAI